MWKKQFDYIWEPVCKRFVAIIDHTVQSNLIVTNLNVKQCHTSMSGDPLIFVT